MANLKGKESNSVVYIRKGGAKNIKNDEVLTVGKRLLIWVKDKLWMVFNKEQTVWRAWVRTLVTVTVLSSFGMAKQFILLIRDASSILDRKQKEKRVRKKEDYRERINPENLQQTSVEDMIFQLPSLR